MSIDRQILLMKLSPAIIICRLVYNWGWRMLPQDDCLQKFLSAPGKLGC